MQERTEVPLHSLEGWAGHKIIQSKAVTGWAATFKDDDGSRQTDLQRGRKLCRVVGVL